MIRRCRQAWRLIDPNAGEAFAALRDAGVKIAVVSNFDTRLRPILEQLGCDHWFDALAISAEVRWDGGLLSTCFC